MKNLFPVLLLISHLAFSQQYKTRPVTGLLGAFGAEVALVKQSLKNPKTVVVDGVSFTTGRIGKQQVVVAETGIGKVNAAMTTALMLNYFRPERILFTGIAGGTNPDLQPGDIVIARQTAHHDYQSITMDRKPTRQTYSLSGKVNPAFFLADSVMLSRAQTTARSVAFEPIPLTTRPPTVITGIVVTGDQFISSAEKVTQLRQAFNADATEMEGAAVAQVCYQMQVPHLVIRSLSDRADDNARNDMLSFYQTAARNSAKLVLAIVEGL
ncbi:5'-methylthioadenosine/adenosylhomocysteine nucleosidase [Spirosoma sp. 209]|uniref:5'-methylthioadenosine/adenosylhomocysteine nucleosidase n=1 Tax=Spirosoma sp. 209 TaxID=1955701 RepID=UPI00098D6692|nr:5'-methylthioadenosine/adenosylhomocysteine nucleosidase [Spirosoma sp. 209]